MKKLRLFINFIPALVVMSIIFGLSLQTGEASTETTGALSNSIAGALAIDPGASTDTSTPYDLGGEVIWQINLLIRSLAHVLAFGGLGLMMMLGCTLSKFNAKWHLGITLGLGSIIAFIDETIKYFIPGRHFSWIDMGKDIVGLILAVIGCWILSLLYNAYISRRRPSTPPTV